MRAMLDIDIPLNAGCLVPLDGKHASFASLFSLSFLSQSEFPVEAYYHRHALQPFAVEMCSRHSAS